MLNDAIELLKACDGLTVEEILAYKESKKPKLKLEAGKRYWRRDGKISGPLTKDDYEAYPFDDAEACYSANGEVVKGHKYGADLIREYIPYNADWDALCNAVREIDAEAADYMEVEVTKSDWFTAPAYVGKDRLVTAFSWADTKQGEEFWNRIDNALPKPFGSAPEPKNKYERWILVSPSIGFEKKECAEAYAARMSELWRVVKVEWEA